MANLIFIFHLHNLFKVCTMVGTNRQRKRYEEVVEEEEKKDYVTSSKELGERWTVEHQWHKIRQRWIKIYHSPDGQKFYTLLSAKQHVDSEKEKDTKGASSSNLLDIQKTYPPAFGSSSTSGSMDIDSAVNGDNGAKRNKGERKQPPKRKRNDSDSSNCGSASSSSTSGSSMDIDRDNVSSNTTVGKVVLVVKRKKKKKKKVCLPKPVDAVDDEERLRRINRLRCEEQQRAESEKQANKRRKEEDKLKREEDTKKRKIKEDKKRKRVEEEDEKRRIEAVSWSLICSSSVSMLLVHFSLVSSSVTLPKYLTQEKEEKAREVEALKAQLAAKTAECEEHKKRYEDLSTVQSNGGNITQQSTESTSECDDILVDTVPVALESSSAGGDDKDSTQLAGGVTKSSGNVSVVLDHLHVYHVCLILF